MPLNIDILQILLHMLNFVILAGGLIFLLFKPVDRFLQERKDYFENREKENQRQSQENSRMQAEYQQKLADAQTEIAEMRTKSEKELADLAKTYLDNAKEKADAIIAAAEKEADERKEHILESAQTDIGELVVTAAQKLLSHTANAERDSALYDEFIRLSALSDKRKRT